jgi:thiamine biosynthesis protein ThiS
MVNYQPELAFLGVLGVSAVDLLLYNWRMKVQINGQERDLDEGLTLAALIEQLGMKSDRVAVELNREIVSRELWPQTSLQSGDRLEIVHFVGGGSGQRPHRKPRQ